MQVGQVTTTPPSSSSSGSSSSIMQPLSNSSGLGPSLLLNYRGQEYGLGNNGSLQFLGYTSPINTQPTPSTVPTGSSSTSSSSSSLLSNLSDTDIILIAGAIVVVILLL